MLRWTFNPQLLVDELVYFVRLLMVAAGAVMALLILFSLIFTVERTNDESASRHGVTQPRRWRFLDGYLNRANRKSTGL
jgi:hypothetical protein